ncbi:MAG: ACP S-malonyltransferase [Burkholderiales bacterium]|nr:ACP S-malonyltransferase [Burkholderiales bacterium]
MKLAFVFPGQGSQSVGMMTPFASDAAVTAAFAEASQALGQDLWQLVATGPVEELARTVNTQPVMLTAGVAVYRSWIAAGGPPPALLAGHSLGEYAALVAAGSITLADAVPLVRFRAQAMQEAVPEGTGAMAAILGLADDDVRAACAEAAAATGQVVEAVNFNAPSQVVIAGHKGAVDKAIEACKARGAKRGLLLPVSAPFHSSLLKPAAERLAERLQSVAVVAPVITVIHNVDLSASATPDAVRSALARQAASPVRWADTIRHFEAAGVTHIAECGPGKVLAGMVKRIAPEIESVALTDPAAIASLLATLKG